MSSSIDLSPSNDFAVWDPRQMKTCCSHIEKRGYILARNILTYIISPLTNFNLAGVLDGVYKFMCIKLVV